MKIGKLRLSYANVMSTIAVFVALGGSAWAVGNSQVKTKHLANGAVTAKKLKNGAVATKKVRNGAVTAAKLRNGAVGTLKLADGSVTAVKVVDGAIVTGKLADSAVTGAKMAPGSVDGSRLTDGAVGAGKLGDGAVTEAKIANGAVGTAQIAESAVTAAEISPLLGLRCGPNRLLVHAACIETNTRNAATRNTAFNTCENAGGRLPTPGELQSYRKVTGTNLGTGNWTNLQYMDFFDPPAVDTFFEISFYVTSGGNLGYGVSATSLAYRCVRMPLG